MHGLIIIDFTIIHGVKVTIFKSSNRVEFGNGGYIVVNVEIMLTLVGAVKKRVSQIGVERSPTWFLLFMLKWVPNH